MRVVDICNLSTILNNLAILEASGWKSGDRVKSQVGPEKNARKINVSLFTPYLHVLLKPWLAQLVYLTSSVLILVDIWDLQTKKDPVILKTISQKLLYTGVFSKASLLKGQKDNDAFVDLDAALEIVVRSRKPKAVELVKWLERKGVDNVVQEKRRAVEEKNMQLALLSNDIMLEQEHARQLEGEIREKDTVRYFKSQRFLNNTFFGSFAALIFALI